MNNLRLYIHIPFCLCKCNYCDFLSFPAAEDTREAYVSALINEIKACGKAYAGFNIASVFIGGGTPSLLSASQMEKIIVALREVFGLKGVKRKKDIFKTLKKNGTRPPGSEALPPVEFTVECNPGTADRAKLKAYKSLGINRLSIGLQSPFDDELKELGRIHTAEDFLDTFETARTVGFDNINVDMMQGIPLQTLGSWKRGLTSIAALRPEHISAYSLIVEEGTPFFNRIKNGLPLSIPGEDEEREIYYVTKDILGSFGYRRYEISNYSVPGYECRHNKGYWTRENYLGLGLGASSMVNNVRWKNEDDIGKYIDIISSGDDFPLTGLRREEETLSHREQMAEYMFLGLRLSEGISKEEFIDTFGVDYDFIFGEVSSDLIEKGLLAEQDIILEDELTGREYTHTRVCLTDKGIDLSNQVFISFIS
ncbi:MAG: radical SAM family heme chaperone HemW [Lachnospiraceae bacterium]|jgi:oxygen-independent coproporphyrinogen-3 oxidase